MREIKFRAWNIKKKEMLPTSSIWKCDFTPYNDGDYTIMQFTGKKDSNSKEIYEGDIMQFYSGLVAKGENPIIRQVVKWNNKRSRYDNIEGDVIGNIYENPELLTK